MTLTRMTLARLIAAYSSPLGVPFVEQRPVPGRSFRRPRLNPQAPLPHLLLLDEGLPPHENRILSLLKADEAMPIDEIVEGPENDLSPCEIFVALF